MVDQHRCLSLWARMEEGICVYAGYTTNNLVPGRYLGSVDKLHLHHGQSSDGTIVFVCFVIPGVSGLLN